LLIVKVLSKYYHTKSITDRNREWRANGILIDNPMELVFNIIPKPVKTQITALLDAEKIMFDYGLTTVNDAGLDSGY
jgi:predicted amidohydrolase YtcJ